MRSRKWEQYGGKSNRQTLLTQYGDTTSLLFR